MGSSLFIQMSIEALKSKLRDANSILSMSMVLHTELLALEKKDYQKVRHFYDSLVLIRTSIFAELLLNLYHLLKSDEKNSIAKLINVSVWLKLLDKKKSAALRDKSNACQQEVEKLKETRDKRIAHYDKKDTLGIDDTAIVTRLKIAEEVLKELTGIILKQSHSYGIALSRDMTSIMDAFGKIPTKLQRTSNRR